MSACVLRPFSLNTRSLLSVCDGGNGLHLGLSFSWARREAPCLFVHVACSRMGVGVLAGRVHGTGGEVDAIGEVARRLRLGWEPSSGRAVIRPTARPHEFM